MCIRDRCVTACPSGVQYGPLIEHTRAQIERHYTRPLGDRLFRSLLFALLPYPGRLRVAMAPLVILGPILRALERRGAIARLADDPSARAYAGLRSTAADSGGTHRLRTA